MSLKHLRRGVFNYMCSPRFKIINMTTMVFKLYDKVYFQLSVDNISHEIHMKKKSTSS